MKLGTVNGVNFHNFRRKNHDFSRFLPAKMDFKWSRGASAYAILK